MSVVVSSGPAGRAGPVARRRHRRLPGHHRCSWQPPISRRRCTDPNSTTRESGTVIVWTPDGQRPYGFPPSTSSVSSGPPIETIPSLTGSDAAPAPPPPSRPWAWLPTARNQYSSTVPNGQVISWNPTGTALEGCDRRHQRLRRGRNPWSSPQWYRHGVRGHRRPRGPGAGARQRQRSSRAVMSSEQHSGTGNVRPPRDDRHPLQPVVMARSDGGCELCEAARLTTWYHEDDVCWVADCEICAVPMVVWRTARHRTARGRSRAHAGRSSAGWPTTCSGRGRGRSTPSCARSPTTSTPMPAIRAGGCAAGRRPVDPDRVRRTWPRPGTAPRGTEQPERSGPS